MYGASPGYLPTLRPCVTQRLLEPGMTLGFCSTQWIYFPQFWAGSTKPHRNFQHPQLPIAESLGHPEIVVAGQEGLAKVVRVWEDEKGGKWQVVAQSDSSWSGFTLSLRGGQAWGGSQEGTKQCNGRRNLVWLFCLTHVVMRMGSERHHVEQGRKWAMVGWEGFSFCGNWSPISASLSSAEADVTELGHDWNHSKANGIWWCGLHFLTSTETNWELPSWLFAFLQSNRSYQALLTNN